MYYKIWHSVLTLLSILAFLASCQTNSSRDKVTPDPGQDGTYMPPPNPSPGDEGASSSHIITCDDIAKSDRTVLAQQSEICMEVCKLEKQQGRDRDCNQICKLPSKQECDNNVDYCKAVPDSDECLNDDTNNATTPVLDSFFTEASKCQRYGNFSNYLCIIGSSVTLKVNGTSRGNNEDVTFYNLNNPKFAVSTQITDTFLRLKIRGHVERDARSIGFKFYNPSNKKNIISEALKNPGKIYELPGHVRFRNFHESNHQDYTVKFGLSGPIKDGTCPYRMQLLEPKSRMLRADIIGSARCS